MPRWKPESVWRDKDVFIIGGGDSLRSFDWTLLEDECTIGCNTAFTLGPKICKICIFGDFKWFDIFQVELTKYATQNKGVVFTNTPKLLDTTLPWLYTMPREMRGLHKQALGWNGNTGASAINLALILGATTVYLLGFDMMLSNEQRPNWHDRLIQKPKASVYKDFCKDFGRVASDLGKVFPGREVVNVTDKSNLEVFPKIGVEEFWNSRKGQKDV